MNKIIITYQLCISGITHHMSIFMWIRNMLMFSANLLNPLMIHLQFFLFFIVELNSPLYLVFNIILFLFP